MTRAIHGIRKWGPLGVDEEGHRTYKLGMLLRTTDKLDGPYQMYRTPGTPNYGSAWSFGNDNDIWAFYTNECTVEKYGTVNDDSAVEASGQPWIFWFAEYTYSTKPPDRKRCSETQINNPLLEPFKYAGDFSKYTEEAYFDMGGRALLNSAWEQLRGQQVEFDRNRPSVVIEQNVSNLQLPLLSAFIDCVNDRPMWGLPARTIKLSSAPWEKIYYGTCYFYFKRTLRFDINYETWDRLLLDEGSCALNGHWHPTTRHWVVDDIDGQPPNRFNPAHFVKFTDFNNQPARVILDGGGLPAGACIDEIPEDYEGTPSVFLAVQGSLGKALNDIRNWIEWTPTSFEVSFATPPNDWRADYRYRRGNIVNHNGLIAICKWININDPPLASTTGNWVNLTIDNPLTNKGTYSKTTSYFQGDYVVNYATLADVCVWRPVGSILVQKYFPANFLLLGVPLILPV